MEVSTETLLCIRWEGGAHVRMLSVHHSEQARSHRVRGYFVAGGHKPDSFPQPGPSWSYDAKLVLL